MTRMRGAIVELKQQIWWVSGFVVGLSLLLVLLFTYLIIHPVRQIESRILSLGAGVQSRISARWMARPNWCCWGSGSAGCTTSSRRLEQQKYQFLRHVSHGKTPLPCCGRGADLLGQLVGPLNGDQQEICQMLEENSRRLQTLIERLLDFQSPQPAGGVHPVRGAWRPCCQNLSEEYRLALESKQISVHLPPSPSACGQSPTACDSSSTISFQRS